MNKFQTNIIDNPYKNFKMNTLEDIKRRKMKGSLNLRATKYEFTENLPFLLNPIEEKKLLSDFYSSSPTKKKKNLILNKPVTHNVSNHGQTPLKLQMALMH